MALALGTNVGFVATAPSTDPGGGDTTIDGSSVVVKDTSPVGAYKITQIGWYRGSGTNTANFEIALYADGSGVATTRLFVDATNSSSSAGWITVTVDWDIEPSTPYWLGLQMDAHTGSSTVDNATSGGSGTDVRTSQTTLNNPYGGGAVADADGMYAIYALVNKTPTVVLNSPADASSDSDTTPTLDFTGTDTEADSIEYEVQVDTATFSNITPSNLTSGNDTDGGSTATTASVSPTSNALVLLTVSSRNTDDSVNPNQPTATGNGLTWVVEDSIVYDETSTSRRRVTVLRAMGASPSSGAISIDFGGDNQSHVLWSVDQFTGVDTSGTNGSGAIVQSVTNDDETGAVSSLTVTLAAFSNVNNITFGAFGWDTTGTPAVGSGFTSLAMVGTTTNLGLGTEYKLSNDTSVDMSMGEVVLVGGIAIEIKPPTRLIDALSSTDAGFVNPDTGGDTDPFNSGENIQYTVQSALAAGTYYWRVRGTDPAGTNQWGAWSSTRSFTITSGGGTAVKDMIGGFIPFAR